MITAQLKDQISVMLQSSSALALLLAKDPNDSSALAIFNARMNDVGTPVYDCITYRVKANNPDPRFRAQPAGSVYGTGIEYVNLEFEIWSKASTARAISEIAGVVSALLHQQTFAIEGANVYYSDWLTGNEDMWDSNLECYFGVYVFRFRIQLQS